MARFGMGIKEFLQLTPKEFYLALKSKNDYDGLVVESNVKMICNSIRSQTLYLLNTQIKRPITNEKKLMRFPWDNETIIKPQTKEQMKNVMKALAGHTFKPKKK